MIDLFTQEKLKKMFHWSIGLSLIFVSSIMIFTTEKGSSSYPLALFCGGMIFGIGLLGIIQYFQIRKIISGSN